MQNINVFIRENISSVSRNVFIAPNIPEKKLNNAAKAMGLTDSVNSIVAIYDNTLFGTATEGLAFTGEEVVYRASFADPIHIRFSELESAKYVKNVTVSDKGKKTEEEFIEIYFRSKQKTTIKGLLGCNYQALTELVNKAITDFESFEQENQLVTLSEMSEELKVAYVQVIVNMAFDGGKVEAKEFAEILQLMTRLKLTSESRFELLDYRASISVDNQKPLDLLLNIIDKNCVPSHIKSVRISLVKDLVSTYMSVNDGKYDNFKFLEQNKVMLGVSDAEIELVVKAIRLDFNMLKDDFTDDALAKGMKELIASAGAVGVPIAAVYLSGSVVGLSAAGLTSGLAALGLGGVLGFSSMVTGIGVAVLVGVGAYKGIKHFTGANELDKTKRRELMLNEVIKQTQSTISSLIEDLNYFTSQLNNAVEGQIQQNEQIKKLKEMMTVFIAAAGVLNKKSNSTQISRTKLHCPPELDHEKLQSLTREATKKSMYVRVMSCYEKRAVKKMEHGESVAVEVMALRNNLTLEDLDELGEIFDVIGYFKAADVLKGKAADAADMLKGKIAGFFSQ